VGLSLAKSPTITMVTIRRRCEMRDFLDIEQRGAAR
jgi:hypothetical protein